MKNILFFFVLFLLTSNIGFAQKNSINGQVIEADGQGLAYGNVLLMAAVDSHLVKLQLSDEKGFFNFPHIPSGAYWVTVSYVGLPDQSTALFTLSDDAEITLPTLVMQTASNDLAEVTVVAKRPLLEVKPDRMVFNVEGSVNATGNNALDLLRKAPGVVVDNNDQVTMMGKSGVQVYINGKKSPLSSEDLAAYLKTLQSTDIDHIDIITNPSAKYEAEGSAGIINIQLKKDQGLGANANLSLGYSIGQKAKYDGSISSNYRNQKTNFFGSYGYYNGEDVNYMELYREQFGLAFDNHSNSGGQWESHNYKAGIDYTLNDKNTIGFLVNGNSSGGNWNQTGRTPISMIGSSRVDSVLVAKSNSLNSRDNTNFNLNYRFDDSKGVVWNIDADYGLFRNNSDQDQPNVYYIGEGEQIKREANFATVSPTDIDIYTFKVDHERALWKGQLGLGLKSGYVKTDNVFDFFNVEGGKRLADANRSNQFVYSEMVNAAYATYSRQFKAWSIQTGLRVENTHSEGDLTTNDTSKDKNVQRTYTDLFPSAGLTYQLNPKNSFQLSYSRRINRPNYQDLNPFESKLDELTFEKGNPFLNPEYANNIQLTHTFNYFLNTSIAYSHTKDLITRITDTYESTGTYITWLNLADQRTYSMNISGSIPVTKWWNSYTNLSGYIQANKADYGDGKIIDVNIPTFNVYSQHTFQLPMDLSMEVSGWYSSASLWGGNFRMNQMFAIDAGIQKKLFDGKGNLKISINDIFLTNTWHGISQFGGLFMDIQGGYDSRRVSLNFSYLLGNNKVKSRSRQTGMEEESKRVKSGN